MPPTHIKGYFAVFKRQQMYGKKEIYLMKKLKHYTIDYTDFSISASKIPPDDSLIGPFLGNNELKLVLDSRGCMHDFSSPPSWPPPRIVWTGRRHNQRIDRYNSNQFEYGFFNVELKEESKLPEVTNWKQKLYPEEGYVETVIERKGGIKEITTTFLCLHQNLIVCKRKYEKLPANISRTVKATYQFCQIGTDEPPFRTTWHPLQPDANGISADFTADGHRIYCGRIALFALARKAISNSSGNTLHLEVELDANDEATICLCMVDDLGDDPQLVDIWASEWMPKGVREVHEENNRKAASYRKPDYVRMVASIKQDALQQGFEKLIAQQKSQWNKVFSCFKLRLPENEAILNAAFKGAIYHIRCAYSNYSWGSGPFNCNWGAHYAWDEHFPLQGLVAFGVDDMPVRVMEWRRWLLPFLSARAGGRGAFYHHSTVEPGITLSERNATSFFELFYGGMIANDMYDYYRYTGDINTLKRYYPVIREITEFYRYWLLVELPGNNITTVPLIDVDEHTYPIQDGPFTIASAARLFDLAVKSAEKLGEDEDMLPTWKRYRDMTIHLVQHCFGEKYNSHGCYVEMHLNEAPAPTIEIDEKITQWKDEYKRQNKPEEQYKKYKQNVAGDYSKPRNWPWGHFTTMFTNATLERTEEVKENMANAFKVLLPFCGQCESAEEDFSRIDHPWFTTAPGALLKALARVFLNPIEGGASLMGAVPPEWKNFEFELPAYNKIWIKVEVADGKIKNLSIKSGDDKNKKIVLTIPERFIPESFSQSQIPSSLQTKKTEGKLHIDCQLKKDITLCFAH
jgi:hypothetical protein